MTQATIFLSDDLLMQLEISRWNRLSKHQQVALAQSLTAQLNASGHSMNKPRLEQHGPNQTVLVWQNEPTQLDFALIPGGTFAPGYADEQLSNYRHICQLIEQGWHDAIVRMTKPGKGSLDFKMDAAITPSDKVQLFGSRAVCDLGRKPSVTLSPFLMCTTLVPAATPGLRLTVDLPKWQSWEKLEATHSAIRLRWPMVEPVLAHFGWDLPTSTEFEWALQAGNPTLFYWGDKLPVSIMERLVYVEHTDQLPNADLDPGVRFEDLMTRDVELQRLRVYPYCNRFGLASMLACGTWCLPSTVPQDPFPLTLRGGAADCFPWQGTNEWKHLLSAADWRIGYTTDYANWNSLRPVMRLRAPPSRSTSP